MLSSAGFVPASSPASLGCCSTILITTRWHSPGYSVLPELEEVFLSFPVTYEVVTAQAFHAFNGRTAQTCSTYRRGARRKHSTQESAFIDLCRHRPQGSAHHGAHRAVFSVDSVKPDSLLHCFTKIRLVEV